MGCWNKTCGLSNLHIIAGTEVYVFVLERNTQLDERCYSTAFFRPLLLPFYSKYNDYGGGEESSGVGLTPIMEGIKRSMVEVDAGENQYHDLAVKKDIFDVDLFFDAVHENRLKVKTYDGDTDVDFVMFRKDVVDDILTNLVRETYVGVGKGTTGYSNSYVSYTFNDVLADIPEFLDRLEACLKEAESTAEYGKMVPRLRLAFLGGLGDLFEWKHTNKVSWYINRDNYRYSQIVRVNDLIIESAAEGNRELAEQLLTDYLKAVYLDSFMEETRKLWMPAGHEGSQSQEHAGYNALIGAMSRALEKERNQMEDENEDDE